MVILTLLGSDPHNRWTTIRGSRHTAGDDFRDEDDHDLDEDEEDDDWSDRPSAKPDTYDRPTFGAVVDFHLPPCGLRNATHDVESESR